jgi:hypothetical protein
MTIILLPAALLIRLEDHLRGTYGEAFSQSVCQDSDPSEDFFEPDMVIPEVLLTLAMTMIWR